MEDYITRFWKHSQTMTVECKHRPNSGVMCDSMTKCENCGWHPETEHKRKREEFKKLGVILPDEHMIRVKRCP